MQYAAVVSPLIMVVEDNNLVAEFVETHLRRQNYSVVVADGMTSALHLLQRITPELLILDVMLDDCLGYDLCSTIRVGGPNGSLSHLSDVPILFLTARADEQDRIRGFDAGADDYVTKPFSNDELVRRIQSLLRRSVGTSHAVLQIGALQIDPRRRQVLVDNHLIDLTPKEYSLLHLLASSAGRVFSRGDLLERVWGYSAQNYTRTVDVHVNRLRQKLAEHNSACGDLVITEWGVGYKFGTCQTMSDTTRSAVSVA